MTIKLKRVCKGEYEYKDYSISKDEYENNLWWLKQEGYAVMEDFYSLSDVRDFIEAKGNS